MYADVTATAEFTGHGSLTVFAVFSLQMSIIMISITFFLPEYNSLFDKSGKDRGTKTYATNSNPCCRFVQ